MRSRHPSIASNERPRSVRSPTATVRLWLIAAAVAAFLLAAVAPAVEDASSATAKPTVQVSPSSVKRGKAITVTGSHWARRATVDLLIGPPQSEATRVATVRTTSGGAFRRKLVPPAWVQARIGRWVLLACRRDCRVKASATFRIVR